VLLTRGEVIDDFDLALLLPYSLPQVELGHLEKKVSKFVGEENSELLRKTARQT
jgi:hypothetical protein